MSGKNPLISVIMSTKDTKKEYLEAAVTSVLKQSYENIELIIVVDGGNDGEILKNILDDRLKIIIHRDSLGLATRLNEAILATKGKYVARMDADDYSLPDRLEKQFRYMEKHPEVDICGTFAKAFGDSKKLNIFPALSPEYLRSELFFSNVLVHPTVMFRAYSIKRYNIKYNSNFRYSQDYELWSRISLDCSFAVIPDVELLYRVHKKQVSSDKKEEQRDYYIQCLSSNVERLGLSKEQSEKYIKAICANFGEVDPVAIRVLNDLEKANNESGVYRRKIFSRVLKRRGMFGIMKSGQPLVIKLDMIIKLLNLYSVAFGLRKVLLILKSVLCSVKYRGTYRKLEAQSK